MYTVGMMPNNLNYWNPSQLPIITKPRRQYEGWMSQQDTADISPQAMLSSIAGLDFDNSNVEYLESRLDFDLEFKSSAFERLSASGYYAEERRELNLSLNFMFQKEVDVDGQTQTRLFEANLSFSASNVKTFSISPFEKKEDVMELVRRVIKSLSMVSQEDDQILGGVLIDPEDFTEIAAIDNGELAQALYSLIQSIMLYTNIMKEMKEDQGSELVVLCPERRKYFGLEMQENSHEIKNLHLEIKDITEEYQESDQLEEPEEIEVVET